jgi:hypothetical protein
MGLTGNRTHDLRGDRRWADVNFEHRPYHCATLTAPTRLRQHQETRTPNNDLIWPFLQLQCIREEAVFGTVWDELSSSPQLIHGLSWAKIHYFATVIFVHKSLVSRRKTKLPPDEISPRLSWFICAADYTLTCILSDVIFLKAMCVFMMCLAQTSS